jgi:ABC-type transport system involved in multi-copper enzyme maturation permease subunit
MNWLIWKDYRHNRVIVYAGLVLLLFPYLIAFKLGWDRAPSSPPSKWTQFIASAGLYSLGLGQITIALIGGNVIAGERVDRSAEFLASLPISRRKILLSKLLLSLAIAAVIWGNLFVSWLLMNTSPELAEQLHGRQIIMPIAIIAAVGLLFFGVAWLFSSFLSSPTFAVAAALIAPLLVGWGLMGIGYLSGVTDRDLNFPYCYSGIASVLGLACFAGGAWYYLRRVEP